MNKRIEKIEDLIEETAEYSRPLAKFILDDTLILKLQKEMTDYVDTYVSYENNLERRKMIQKLVIGSLRQITKRLQDNEKYWEILSSLELANLGLYDGLYDA